MTEVERKDVLARELEQLDRLTALARLHGPRLTRALTRQATHVQALLGREVPPARQLLRKLLADRSAVRPSRSTAAEVSVRRPALLRPPLDGDRARRERARGTCVGRRNRLAVPRWSWQISPTGISRRLPYERR